MLTSAVATPARASWIGSASVGVARPSATICTGIFSLCAVLSRWSKRTGLMLAPRDRTGPPPSLTLPSRFSAESIMGWSVAKVTSTAMPTSGAMPKVEVVAPRLPISSCTVPTAWISAFGLSRASCRAVSRTTKAPARSSNARPARRPLGRSSTPWSITMGSPTATSFSASLRSLAPMSTHRSVSGVTRLRSSAFWTWMGTLPMTPGTTPLAVRTETRCPCGIWGSQPPIGEIHR